jgi:hypothetical protein
MLGARMPEASVDEDGDLAPWEDDIGARAHAGEGRAIYEEPVPASM